MIDRCNASNQENQRNFDTRDKVENSLNFSTTGLTQCLLSQLFRYPSYLRGTLSFLA